jgi:hypothetical protein
MPLSQPITEAEKPPDLLILSNGPGELYTWVQPLVSHLGRRFRISIALAPCPHASGHEAEAASRFSNVARVLPPAHFWRLVLGTDVPQLWHLGPDTAPAPASTLKEHWQQRGVVLFLGGDQFFAGCIAKRLGYPCVAYAEWEAMWPGWISFYAVRRHAIRRRAHGHWLYRLFRLWVWILSVLQMSRTLRRRLIPKVIVIGDLTTDSVWQYGDVRRQAESLRHRYLSAYAKVCSSCPQVNPKQEGAEGTLTLAVDQEGSTCSDVPMSFGGVASRTPSEHLTSMEITPGSAQSSLNRTESGDPERHRKPADSRPLIIGLLPGSKPSKLAIMVPFLLLCAYYMHLQAVQLGLGPLVFVLPVAPGLDKATLQRFADPNQNSMFDHIPGASARPPSSIVSENLAKTTFETGVIELCRENRQAAAVTTNGESEPESPGPATHDPSETHWFIDQVSVSERERRAGERQERRSAQVPVFLHEASPAYALLAATDLCLTTVGANTAELASLWIPSMVLVPTHRLDVMRAWDGLLGILCRLPILGTWITIVINRLILWLYATRRWGYFALPNRWAGHRELLPERVGRLDAEQVAAEALSLALDRERCNAMRRLLQEYARPCGSVRRLAVLVQQALRSDCP